MRRPEFWTPLIVALVVTPPALLLGIGSAGAGHGDYFWAKILFPYTMLSTVLFESITVPFLVLAIVQFPLYGLSLGYAKGKRRLAGRAAVLLSAHLLAVVLVLSAL